jgi:hypothetical protein
MFVHMDRHSHYSFLRAMPSPEEIISAAVVIDVYDRYGGLVFETRTFQVTGRVEPSGQLTCESRPR